MKKLSMLCLSCFTAMSLLAGCASKPEENTSGLKDVTLVLDFVPNTNHTGFYVAQEKGYFEEAGLNVNIIEPGDDSTSATLVATGKGEFGVSYQEDVTYAQTAKEPLPIRAIAAIIQHNTSGFVTLKEDNITSPKDFEGKVYSGWQTPSEEAVIRAVMNQAGADFDKLTMVGADGYAELGKSVDLLWDFEGWTYRKHLMNGLDLSFMSLRDLDARLDYYTPVIITNEDMIENDPETIQAFMDATKKGYEYAIENPEESAEILHKFAPDYDLDFLIESQKFLSAQYALDAPSWGVMKEEVWTNYTDFMYEYKLIDKKIDAKDQYTNDFIE